MFAPAERLRADTKLIGKSAVSLFAEDYQSLVYCQKEDPPRQQATNLAVNSSLCMSKSRRTSAVSQKDVAEPVNLFRQQHRHLLQCLQAVTVRFAD
ncbi:unnamed protein product [Dibothriocephalus latus]|uniref:Uncharacterized protein n=1 Tax=Dibothriocephalus latus TaxID=60516 RepID=A0A3P6P4S8_DIBLA|nr:unnamed protein product [Dibothriocephalus latus]